MSKDSSLDFILRSIEYDSDEDVEDKNQSSSEASKRKRESEIDDSDSDNDDDYGDLMSIFSKPPPPSAIRVRQEITEKPIHSSRIENKKLHRLMNRKRHGSSMRRAGAHFTDVELMNFEDRTFMDATKNQKRRLQEITKELKSIKSEVIDEAQEYVDEGCKLLDLSIRRYTRERCNTLENHRELFFSHTNTARKAKTIEALTKRILEKVESIEQKLDDEIKRSRNLNNHYWMTMQNITGTLQSYAMRRPLFRKEDKLNQQEPMIKTPFITRDG